MKTPVPNVYMINASKDSAHLNRPSKSLIAREASIMIREWANWKTYHAILTYNDDSTGVLQLYKHSLDSDPVRLLQMSDFTKGIFMDALTASFGSWRHRNTFKRFYSL
jgi:hypothetical protein